jgi:hypothetical protein
MALPASARVGLNFAGTKSLEPRQPSRRNPSVAARYVVGVVVSWVSVAHA